MQEERAKVNASIAEPQTRLSERALPSMAPVLHRDLALSVAR